MKQFRLSLPFPALFTAVPVPGGWSITDNDGIEYGVFQTIGKAKAFLRKTFFKF